MSENGKRELGPDDITAEGSLWDVWKLSRSLEEPVANIVIFLFSMALVVGYTVLFTPVDTSRYEIAVTLAREGFRFTTITLGFLMAGLSMFSGIVRSRYAIDLSRFSYPDAGMSYLKVMLLSVMKPFICFLVASVLFFSISLLAVPVDLRWGPSVAALGTSVRPILGSVLFITVVGVYVVLLLSIKSFVFNIYKSVTSAVRHEVEFGEKGGE